MDNQTHRSALWTDFGGDVKPANHKENRRDRCLWINQSGKRRCVVIIREPGGKTLPLSVPL